MRAFRRPAYLITLCALQPLQARFSFAEDKNEKAEESIFDTARSSLKGIDTNAIMNFMTSGPMLDASKISHQIFESSIPGKVSFGFAMYLNDNYVAEIVIWYRGFSSGYFIKKSTKIVAFAVGGVFALVQFLASQGYITLNYDKLSQDFEVRICLCSF